MEKGPTQEAEQNKSFSVMPGTPTTRAESLKARRRAMRILGGGGLAGPASAVRQAKADELIKVAPDGNGGPAIAENMDENGAGLGTLTLDVGPDSQPNGIVPLQTEGIALVAVATEASPSGNENGDIFSLNSSGVSALGFGINTFQPTYSLSADEPAGLWSFLSQDINGVVTWKTCKIDDLTNCEDFMLPISGIGRVETNLSAPEPHVVVFCGAEWGVISLGQDTDLDGFPDGPATVEASGVWNGPVLDSHINRFGLNGASITFGLDDNGNLVAIEADGSSLAALQGAGLTDMGPVGFNPTSMNANDGKIVVSGTASFGAGRLKAYVEGTTPSNTIPYGSTLTLPIMNTPAYNEAIGFDSLGNGWLNYTDILNGPTGYTKEFDPSTMAFTGNILTNTTYGGGWVFTVLQTPPAGDDDDATPPPVDLDGDGWTEEDGDCDDADPANFPDNPEVCDGADNDCDGAPGADEADADFDGFMECEGDCDDTIPNVNPGQTEIMGDGVDNDCDPTTLDTPDDPDEDGDGFPASADCNDTNPAIHPGAPETCDDTIDSDCDESDNDGATVGLEDTYPDLDGDGEAADGASATPYCPSEVPANTQPAPGMDCDDADPNTYTNAPELMNGEDNDCDNIPAASLGANIQNRDETLLGSTTDAAQAGPNVLEAGGVNIRPVISERTIDEFGDPVDLFAYNRQILALDGVFSVDRSSLPDAPEIVVHEIPEGAPPDWVSATGLGIRGSRAEVQANADGTTRYTCTNTEGNHYVEVTTNFYTQEVWDAYLAANPNADATLILETGQTILVDTTTGEILETDAPGIEAFKAFADTYTPGDDDDNDDDDNDDDDNDDDDTGDDDTGDDDTGDDDTDDDDTGDDDTETGDDDEGADDDDTGTDTNDGCANSGCNIEGVDADNGLDQLPPMSGAVLSMAIILTALKVRAARSFNPRR